MMGDRYCINCGEKVMDGASYCHSCGSRVGKPSVKSKGTDRNNSAGYWGQMNGKFAEAVRPLWVRQGSFGEFGKIADVWKNHTSKSKPVPKELLNNKWRTRGLIFAVIGLGALFLPFIKDSIFGAGFSFSLMLEMEETTMPTMIICGILLNLLSFWKIYPLAGFGGGALLLGTAYMINQQVADSYLGNNILGMLLVSKSSGFYALLISGIGSVFCAYKLSRAVRD